MSKKLQLSIPKPCHENWDAMTPVEKGKFCGSCQKQVVDFSTMSDRQVAQFFKKPSTGSVCGRFMTDQLEREIEIPKKRIPWFKYFFQFALPAFLFSVKASAQQTKGKIKVTTCTKDTTAPMRPTMGMVAPRDWDSPTKGEVEVIKLSGTLQLKVVDDKGNPIPYASIETGVIGKGGVTNKSGVFSLDKSILNVNGKIFVSSGGYERKEIAVKTFSHLNGTFTVALQNKGWLNEVVVPVCRPTGWIMGDTIVMPVKFNDLTVINGKVVDEKGEPVPYASVVVKGARIGVMTNSNGEFSVNPAGNWDVVTLVASNVSFESKEAVVAKASYKETLVIQLNGHPNEMLLGVIVYHKPPTKKELKNVPLIPAIKDPVNPAFKVFPNPAEAGSNLNIEVKQTEEGYYTLQLLNGSGQSVHQQEIWIDADAKLLSIEIPEVAAGNYFLSLTNKKTRKTFTEKLLIE